MAFEFGMWISPENVINKEKDPIAEVLSQEILLLEFL
ncbi:hypothetical protein KKE78_02765 [Patescibacteria group bacterium]|nr:hypothetical protein [Patescibacteria group bacterium]